MDDRPEFRETNCSILSIFLCTYIWAVCCSCCGKSHIQYVLDVQCIRTCRGIGTLTQVRGPKGSG